MFGFSMFQATTIRRALSVGFALTTLALTAQAAPNLSLTVAGLGTFLPSPVTPPPPAFLGGCSRFSPQYANQATFGGVGCIQTVVIWVYNSGPNATSGQVTVTNTFPLGILRGGTLIQGNNFCAYGPGGCIFAGPQGSNKWTCAPSFNFVSCGRTDGGAAALAGGQSWEPIFLQILIEDFVPSGMEFDDLATVTGGGSASFSKFTNFSDNIPPTTGSVITEMIIHTVPEGLRLLVDGVIRTGGDSSPFFWTVGSIHTIQTDDGAGNSLNPGFTLVPPPFTGGLTTSPLPPAIPGGRGPFIVNIQAPDYTVLNAFHDYFVAVFTKP